MIIVYLLSGPLIAAISFAVLVLSGSGIVTCIVYTLLLGFCAPLLVAVLHLAINRELRMKIVNKRTIRMEQ